MNGIIKGAFKLNGLRALANPLKNAVLSTSSKRQITRNLWHMCNSRQDESVLKTLQIKNPTQLCGCGCGIQGLHTKGERELVEFLAEEILAERKAQKVKNLATELDGFKVKVDDAEVTLTKTSDKETINVYFNVNHTVDAEPEADIDPNMDKPEFAEMKSKPQFEVEIVRGKSNLSFTCSFIADAGQQDDIFGIDEVTFFSGEWEDKKYAVAGDVLDGYLYDLLMNLLEEKGISNEFVEKLSELSTQYEHSLYIGLLENLSKFATEIIGKNEVKEISSPELQKNTIASRV
ncbi:complement component 1 Q subcomponent-binding protein, mitochondrial isoform X2 [Chrysoperla carnea]|uniref:complement component 1 Q subcomponent-binding protein, mitochondrial isoform X2 n=1 Tax=Chrysoperla carnea TaxID=189513 RepID=UPI001D096CA1|nr:complement component 1 Q subcomponent-binding protein, mitochondrial isoform X2 [Chrysoperla carnea]